MIVSGVILAFFSLLHRKENKLKWAMKEHEQQVYEEKVRFLININHELRTPTHPDTRPVKAIAGITIAGRRQVSGYPKH